MSNSWNQPISSIDFNPSPTAKEVLRGRHKIYLADPAIAPAVLLKGKAILDDPIALAIATETAVFKHLFARYYAVKDTHTNPCVVDLCELELANGEFYATFSILLA